MSYKESEGESAAQVESNDTTQQQGRKKKLKAMEDEASLKKVITVCKMHVKFIASQMFSPHFLGLKIAGKYVVLDNVSLFSSNMQ